MNWQVGKQYWCCDGKTKARIYAVDGSSDYPIHGAVYDSSGWSGRTWMANGFFHSEERPDELDLTEREVKEPRKIEFFCRWTRVMDEGGYINITPNDCPDGYLLLDMKNTKVTVEEILEENT